MLAGPLRAADRPHLLARSPSWYGRRLDRSLDYRPVTALFAARGASSRSAFMYMHTSTELAPEEDQGVAVRADQGAAIRQSRLPRMPTATSSTRRSPRSRRPICASSSTAGSARTSGIAGMILKPWDERTRSAQQIKPLVQAQGQRGRRACRPSSSRCRRCRARSAACRCRW